MKEKQLVIESRFHSTITLYRVPHEKVSINNLIIRPAHGCNSQFFNFFGFSISINFVQCIT